MVVPRNNAPFFSISRTVLHIHPAAESTILIDNMPYQYEVFENISRNQTHHLIDENENILNQKSDSIQTGSQHFPF